MKGIGVQLCRHGVAALMALQSVALAQSMDQALSLAQLRDQLLMHELISGRFAQCTTHGSASIAGSGEFTFEPGRRIELNFDRPNHYSIIFFSDGTQTRTVRGIEQKTPRYSPLSSLMFSIMSMRESLLDSRFEIILRGTIDQFSMSLVPKKRMARMLKSVEITGVAGLVNTLQIATQDHRAISIHLFPAGQSGGVTCG